MNMRLVASLITVALFAAAGAQAQTVARGQQLAEEKACVSCHGEGLNKPVSPNFPKIAGQYQDYVYHALRQYTPKLANNAYTGRNNAVMGAIVGGMSDNELRDLAAYVASLPSELYVKKTP